MLLKKMPTITSFRDKKTFSLFSEIFFPFFFFRAVQENYLAYRHRSFYDIYFGAVHYASEASDGDCCYCDDDNNGDDDSCNYLGDDCNDYCDDLGGNSRIGSGDLCAWQLVAGAGGGAD